ncbi:MAG TPA: polyphosphate kinase 2 family protein [Steroidobacteraceae bacterium]|nr:polyphosphate kinase 2 family protein [Steroidobacteraceae bacterium]
MGKNVNAADLPKLLRVKPRSRVTLGDALADATHGWQKREAEAVFERNKKRLEELQYTLYAEGVESLLVVLQAMDTAGKDSTIRNVMTAFNPQGCTVHAFKVPNDAERQYDYLWRAHMRVPPLGSIAVFNRSHYEDVLVARVEKLVGPAVWKRRYRHINEFERLLTDCNTRVVKFFLHISKDEQKERLEERLDDPAKHWKWDAADLDKRKQWRDYMEAYEATLARCSTAHAPWYVVPANRKWFRNLAVSQILVNELESLSPKLPVSSIDPADYRIF